VIGQEGTSGRLILMDCLTLLLTNRFLAHIDNHGAVREGEDIYADEKLLEEASAHTLIISKIYSNSA
jgi:adenosyl cobinamide kinase/adenosyl cobinamide phosphate guanylyltransferase